MTPGINTTSISKRLKFFFDEVTRRKIDRHLSDINDTISDEDINNVITDIRSGVNSDSGVNVHTAYSSTLPDENAQPVPASWNI